jgi:hypothetical protein
MSAVSCFGSIWILVIAFFVAKVLLTSLSFIRQICAGNFCVSAGTYSVSFNRVTGVYSFSVLSTTNFDKAGLVLYPNPTTTTFAINGAFEKVQVYAITGQLVKTFTKTIANQNFNIADLKSGVYFVKAVDASNIEKTSKLIKQ